MEATKLYIIIITVFAVVIGNDIYRWSRGRAFTKPELRLQHFRSGFNFTTFILGTTLLVVSICFHINIFHYSTPVQYENVKNITLADFKGYRLPAQTLDGDKEFAFITTSIEWKKENDNLVIASLFHPSRSYVFDEHIVDRFLLQHELYHFHITEYFARLCRRDLSNLKQMPSASHVREIISFQKHTAEAMQYAYDEESYHGYVLKEQKRWQFKIDSLLTSVEKYSNPKIMFN
jgi:hypothetical protein